MWSPPPCRAPTCRAAAFHPRGPAVARAPDGSTCRAESSDRWSPARLGTPASAAALRLSGSSRSWLALGCDGSHRPWALADPLARCPQPLAPDDTNLEWEGGVWRVQGWRHTWQSRGAAPNRRRVLGDRGVCLFPIELFKNVTQPTLSCGAAGDELSPKGTSRRRAQRELRCQYRPTPAVPGELPAAPRLCPPSLCQTKAQP